MKKIEEYKKMKTEEIRSKILELSKDIALLKHKVRTGKEKSTHKIKENRKDMARLETILKQREVIKMLEEEQDA